ncbi:MAG: bifunctional phosphoglucose/phosphomannose isomerase [candidate division WOR-3 bacterium]|nr:bifunctional phosphoglucose/phosphomannose isomerase [candidate division WOR-3 bacterium]MDH7518560.1 bifunctional phosphoglucose/phosphomannose isomerase [bacterium]
MSKFSLKARTMLKLIQELPQQLGRAVALGDNCPILHLNDIDNVIIAGMGGSAMGGDIVRTLLLEEGAVPVTVWRDYQLPAPVNKKTILFLSSYSGNTEETLTAYEEGRRRGARIFVLTSGGRLAAIAQADNLPLIVVPDGMPPRTAVGYMSVPILIVLNRLKLCRDYRADIAETQRLLERRFEGWRRRANGLGGLITGRLPVVYSTARLLDVAAYRWQCQLNENAKMLCHSGQLPEQSHNEIMGYGAPHFLKRMIYTIVLVDKSSHPRTLQRLKEMAKLLSGHWAGIRLVPSEGRSPLARLFSAVMMADLVSVAVARKRGVDPIAIPRIDELKQALARRGGVL